MMPKGVEHFDDASPTEFREYVKIPMMPKGVEHQTVARGVGGLSRVKIPMMPKGVEHCMFRRHLFNLIVSEDSNDAERR